jgi:large subunit ribosomal protein L10
LGKFSKNHESLKIKTGIVNGKILDESMVKSLISMPSRETLLARLAVTLQSGLLNLLNVIEGIISQITDNQKTKTEDNPAENKE